MKLIHLSDLHIGKRVNEFSMLDDQDYILRVLLEIIDRERPDGVLIAGDIYDKTVPSGEAVQLFDDFLARLAARDLAVFLISGNHDSPERVAFGRRILGKRRVFISPVYDGTLEPVTLEDEHGPVDVFLLPFIKPAHVRAAFPEEPVESYTDAVRLALSKAPLDPARRNVLVTHQFVTGAARCESEELSIGGSDNVDGAVFDAFDYVALGHLHGPQRVGRDTLRYCGTPLKYSFSESGHTKSVTLVELGPKGQVAVTAVPLAPRRDLREIKGPFAALTDRQHYESAPREDYLHVTLTDEEDIPGALAALRAIYPNLMKLDYDNARTRAQGSLSELSAPDLKSPLELFGELYEAMNGGPMSERQRALAQRLIEQSGEVAQ